jgi:hypothetical protein
MNALTPLLTPTVESQRSSILSFRTWSPATASLVSGTALALMVVLAAVGYYGGIVSLVTPGNATKTAADISHSGLLFLGGIASIFVVILLDVIVALAWYTLFKRVNPRLSAIAAWVRVVYAGLFAVAASQLVNAYTILHTPSHALEAIELFNTIWLVSLGLFGVHLTLIGYLQLRSKFVPKIFGILLTVTGAGYLADALGVAFVDGFTPVYGLFAIFGETASIFWLLIKGRKLTPNP